MSNKRLSDKYQSIEPSVTLKIVGKAKAMIAAGEDVISFSAGEPDFKTPQKIREAAIEAINEGRTGYTAATGMPELKAAIIRKLKRDHNLDYEMNEILVSNGAKHSLFNVLQAICNEGDEVIIPSPYWVSYPEMVRMAGATPVYAVLNPKEGFAYDMSALEGLVTDKTKAILINSPNNPTGAVYNRETLQQLADIAVKHDLFIISDEIYEKLTYEGEHVSVASLSEEIKSRTILINGLSKAYAMTGWRIGYTAAPANIAKIMGNMQSHATSNPNTIAQYAGIVALDQCEEDIMAFKEEFNRRRQLMCELLDQIEGVACDIPKGAFYVMVPVDAFIGKKHGDRTISDTVEFCDVLLDNQKMATVPGSAFGLDGYIRLSYATSDENIIEGVKRFKTFVENLY